MKTADWSELGLSKSPAPVAQRRQDTMLPTLPPPKQSNSRDDFQECRDSNFAILERSRHVKAYFQLSTNHPTGVWEIGSYDVLRKSPLSCRRGGRRRRGAWRHLWSSRRTRRRGRHLWSIRGTGGLLPDSPSEPDMAAVQRVVQASSGPPLTC